MRGLRRFASLAKRPGRIYRSGALLDGNLLAVGGYHFRRAVVFDADLVDRAQVDVFPNDFGVAVVEYDLEILIAARFVRELEQPRFVVVEVSVTHAIVAPIGLGGRRNVDLANRVAGLVDERKVGVARDSGGRSK